MPRRRTMDASRIAQWRSDMRHWTAQMRTELRVSHLAESLRLLKLSPSFGTREYAADELRIARHTIDDEAGSRDRAKELSSELKRLDLAALDLKEKLLQDALKAKTKFRPDHRILPKDIPWIERKSAEIDSLFTTGNRRQASAPDVDMQRLVGPTVRRGRPEFGAPWVATFPKVFAEFGPQPKKDYFVHRAQTSCGKGRHRPSRREVLRRLARVLSIVAALEKKSDEIIEMTRKLVRTRSTRDRSFGMPLKQAAREHILFRLYRLPVPDIEKEAAADIFLLRHRRELGRLSPIKTKSAS